MALVSAAVLWLLFLVLEKLLPAHAALIGILALAAEAGVVGGLADWYAVTVLFRNPFGKLPMPRLLLEHTEIIPRNKARIAESMGRFVQENFLAAPIVRQSLRNTDASLMIGRWLADEENVAATAAFLQRVGPRLLQVFESRDIEAFIQQNAVEWAKNTPVHQMTSEMLRAVLENDFHHEALQRGLDAADKWIKANPEKARDIAATIFEELGVGGLARGASWIGIDVQQRTINTFMDQVEKLLEDREHPWRVRLEASATQLMKDLRKKTSRASKKLNATKNALADSESVVKFMTGATVILRDAIKRDLERPDSGLASNLRGILLRLGEHLQQNERVRLQLNHEIEEAVVTFTTDYADAIIAYVSEKIHDWDTREMIAKIETEVGGDLHMIRVNGVVVGAFIGLLLGLGRLAIDALPF
ncbi:MAG: DUF445 domain-containing protein [Moraxellaceae bacterium]|nr:DUF445 domain-containing protein [Moraxellaceae bacterium]